MTATFKPARPAFNAAVLLTPDEDSTLATVGNYTARHCGDGETELILEPDPARLRGFADILLTFVGQEMPDNVEQAGALVRWAENLRHQAATVDEGDDDGVVGLWLTGEEVELVLRVLRASTRGRRRTQPLAPAHAVIDVLTAALTWSLA